MMRPSTRVHTALRTLVVTAVLLCLSPPASAFFLFGRKANTVSEEAIARAGKILRSSAAFSEKHPYSETIPYLYLGYDREGAVEQAVAMRPFKTYEWVTALVTVEVEDGRYVITRAEIPDIARIEDRDKRTKVTDALRTIKGRVVREPGGPYRGVDAVTGATRYHKRIFLYFDKLAEAAVKEMIAGPDWPKKPTE